MTRHPLFTCALISLALSTGCAAPADDPETPDAPDVSPDADLADAPDIGPDIGPDAAPSLDPEDYLPSEPGPYRAGFRQITTTYSPFEGAPERTITVNVWYPTLAESGAPTRYLGVFIDRGSLSQAPLADTPRASYPVHVHSHGDQGYGGSCAHVMRHFASHGWVTVAPDHKDNTIQDNVQPREVAMYYWRPLDLTASLDALEALPSDDPLAGRADTARVLLSGYSFGAYTAWASAGASFDAASVDAECEAAVARGASACTDAQRDRFAAGLGDPRVAAAVPIAGTLRTSWFGDQGHTPISVPVLSISGSQDNPESHASQWSRVSNALDMLWLELEGACHAGFSFGGCSDLDTDTGFLITDAYMLAFARKHVLGDDAASVSGILSGEVEVDAAATLKRLGD